MQGQQASESETNETKTSKTQTIARGSAPADDPLVRAALETFGGQISGVHPKKARPQRPG